MSRKNIARSAVASGIIFAMAALAVEWDLSMAIYLAFMGSLPIAMVVESLIPNRAVAKIRRTREMREREQVDEVVAWMRANKVETVPVGLCIPHRMGITGHFAEEEEEQTISIQEIEPANEGIPVPNWPTPAKVRGNA